MIKSVDPKEEKENSINLVIDELYDEYNKLNATVDKVKERWLSDKEKILTIKERMDALETTIKVLRIEKFKNYADN